MNRLSAGSIARIGGYLAVLLALLAAQVNAPGAQAVGLADSLAAGSSGTVQYHDGSVMHTTTTYAIFWKQVDTSGLGMSFYYEAPRCYGPGCITDLSTDNNYKNLTTRFLQDVGGTTYYSLLTQYWDRDSNFQPVPVYNESTFAGSWEDNSNFPNLSRNVPGATVYDSDIQGEIQKAIQANGWKVDASSLFIVYLPEEVQSCSPNQCSPQPFNGDICGYHTSFDTTTSTSNTRVTVRYAVIPSPGDTVECDHNVLSPNSDIISDEAINITSHELFEAVSNPLGQGWYDSSVNDSSKNEIGDKCVNDFPSTTGTLGANLSIGGHNYIVQSEWSELDGACKLGHTPIPYLTSLGSLSTQAQPSGGAGLGDALTLPVNGHNFTTASTVQWNGTAVTTKYISSKQLSATIPVGDLETPDVATITVNTPGGGTSNTLTFYVTQTNVALQAVQILSGSNLTLALGTAPATVSVTANGGPGTVALAQYGANPVASATTAASTNAFFDVLLGPGSSFSSLTITDCNLNGGSQVQWYNRVTQAWAPASKQSYDQATGCATVTVDSTTTPSLAQLNGTPLGAVNVPPSWSATLAQTQDYHDALSFSLTATDPEGNHLTLSVAGGSSLAAGLSLTDHGDGTATVAGTLTAQAGDYPVTFNVSDGVNPAVAQTVTIHVAHEETSLTYIGDTSSTYGAPAQLAATLREDQSGPALPNEPVAFTLGSGAGAQSCSPTPTTDSSGKASCTLAKITQPAGSYTLAASFGGDPNYQGAASSPTFTVAKQSAVVTAAATDANPVQVSTAGGTARFTLQASVAGTLAGGTITNAVPVVYTLTPVGPGTSYTCTDSTGSGVSGGVLSSSCTFSGIAVNVYQLSVSLTGSYYSATPATSVVTVYDPSLGFTTGGGSIVHNGVAANFGFNAKYLKSGQIQGNVLYVEHRSSGDVVLKSNAMSALSIVPGSDGSALLAYIQGKATFQGVGNYAFTVTAIDADGQAPSSNPDQFGLQVTDPAGAPPSGLTFAPVTLSGGTIMVPHK